jgi:hypothetical protein
LVLAVGLGVVCIVSFFAPIHVHDSPSRHVRVDRGSLIDERTLPPPRPGTAATQSGKMIVSTGQLTAVSITWLPALVLILVLYPAGACAGARLRRYRRRRKGLCVSCGYNLTGNVTGVCSACGEVT